MAAECAERGRAMETEINVRGALPKAFDRCTRSALPPMGRWTIWRSVAFSRSFGARAFCGSGICCEQAHEPTHASGVAGLEAAARTSARRRVRMSNEFRMITRWAMLLCVAAAAIVAGQEGEQDHQNMMEQLGIRALRPGKTSDPKSPNAANYDEQLANPYPDLPDVLTCKDGTKVATPEMWWNKRRPEIVEDFEREVYGRVPANAPKVTWTVAVSEREFVGFTPVIARKVIGHVDSSADPQIEVNIAKVVVTPANATQPVPLLMMFGPALLPMPMQPPQADLDKINAALRELLIKQDPSLEAVFKNYPAYSVNAAQSMPLFGLRPPSGDPPTTQQLIADGWGYALLDPATIQADNAEGLTRGVIGLVSKGQRRKPDQWGALRAWAWGAGRALDYLETDRTVDSKHVGIEGVSRYGKAALVTLAFDQRFAMGLIGSSGEGGTKLHRRNFGEAVENLTGGEYYWMAGNFLKYGAAESSFGSKTASDLPVDSHELIALCAPRLTFISYGIPEQGDAKWLDQRGSFMAAVAAGRVFRLLGAKDLGVGDDYKNAQLPPVNHGLLDGQLAWRQHDGGHTDAPNVKYFIAWADKFIGHEQPRP